MDNIKTIVTSVKESGLKIPNRSVFKASMITQVPSLLRSITNIILWIIMKYPLDLISKHTGYTLTRVSNSESLCCILCVYKPGHTAFTAGN